MKSIKPNPNWKHGFKYLAKSHAGDVVFYIRNGQEMRGYFMDADEAKELAEMLTNAAYLTKAYLSEHTNSKKECECTNPLECQCNF